MGLLNKFPSFDFIYKNAAATFVRFPFTLASAVLGAVVGVMLVESDKQSQEYVLQKLGMVAALGLPLYTALSFYAEKKMRGRTKSYALQAAAAVVLAVYFFSLPENPESPNFHLQRFMLLNISFHFLVAFIPFLGGNQVQGFWQYNKSLFLRFLTAALYSAVLYIGLTIALAALDYLFGVDITWKSYMKLWIVIASVFQSWVFLAGVPTDLNALNSSQEYPKGLKVLAQYILLPLVALYFLILISYEFKIIFEWNLPKGWVSQMVLWFSVVGILSLLLLHPLRERTESKWIKVFSKWFFRILLPLLGMLFFAIWVRIADYGITENRYYVMAMAIGLSFVVFYFIFSKTKDIRIIPMVVFATAILSAFGPWGAFAVSKASQQGRMGALLVENGLFVDSVLQPGPVEMPIEVNRELSSITKYLSETHGSISFSKWLSDSAINSLDTVYANARARKTAEQLGFAYQGDRWFIPGEIASFMLNRDPMIALSVFKYDYALKLSGALLLDPPGPFKLGGNDFYINRDSDKSGLSFKFKLKSNARNIEDSILVDLEEALSALINDGKTGRVRSSDLTFEYSADKFELKLIFESINVRNLEEALEVNNYDGIVLVRLK